MANNLNMGMIKLEDLRQRLADAQIDADTPIPGELIVSVISVDHQTPVFATWLRSSTWNCWCEMYCPSAHPDDDTILIKSENRFLRPYILSMETMKWFSAQEGPTTYQGLYGTWKGFVLLDKEFACTIVPHVIQ